MMKCLLLFAFSLTFSLAVIAQGETKLLQDDDGLIHFDFVNELGQMKSVPIMFSDISLMSYYYNPNSQVLAFVTSYKGLAASGFTGTSFRNITFKFLKFNQTDYSFDYLYQTSFRFDKEAASENYNFISTDQFQMKGKDQKGFISFDLKKGTVTFMDDGAFTTKEMAQLKLKINSEGVVTYHIPEKLSYGTTFQSKTLFK